MPDDNDSADVGDVAAETGGPRAGERLGEARRKQQITVSEVAKELHLDEYKIRALEENRFDVLGAPVFAKGHLKKYSQLVGVSMDDVLAEYYELNRTPAMPPVVGEVRKPRREPATGPWVAGVAIVILLIVAYWFFVARQGPETPATPVPAQPADEPPVQTESPTDDAPGADASAGAEASPATLDEDAGDEPRTPEADAEPVEPIETSPPAPAAEGEVRLVVRFSEDCWTEVRDASGRRLYFDLARAGREVDVTGPAPLSVLLGNADSASIRVDGQEYRIADADRDGRTAQLTIRAR